MKRILMVAACLMMLVACGYDMEFNVDFKSFDPITKEAYHGETLRIRPSCYEDGNAVVLTGYTGEFYWQTNGMENVYWKTNVTITSEIDASEESGVKYYATTLFTPEMDCGADRYNCFYRLISTQTATSGHKNYRIHFQLVMHESPGAYPNVITMPPLTLDFSKTEVVNAPWPTGDDFTSATNALRNYVDAQIIQQGAVTPLGVTNIATRITSNVVTKAYVEGLGISAGLSTNEVNGIIASSNLATVAALVAATNSAATEADGTYLRKVPNGYTSEFGMSWAGISLVMPSWEVNFNGGWGTITAGDDNQTLPTYLNSLAWRTTSNKSFSDYGITNNVGEDTETVSALVTTTATHTASINAWATYWDGDEVRVTITNYYGASDIPHLYIEQRTNDTGTALYKTVWDEVTRWNKFLGSDWSWTGWAGAYAFKTNLLDELDNKADRAWGYYDSHAGTLAPADYATISASNLMIAAGLAYQRTVTTGGCAIWVLTATEPTTVSGTTNGAFQVKDADGNVQVELVKGSKRTVGARCGGVSVSNSTLTANYAVASSSHPTGEVSTNLNTWVEEGQSGCAATVTWTGSSGAWVASVTPTNASATKIFFKASYESGGEDMLYSHVAVKFTQLVIGTTTYNVGTATVSSNTVLTLTEAD